MEYLHDQERAQKAYDALLKYLTVSMRSERECRNKLYEKGFHRDEVESAIERAKGYRFIDDEEYARSFVNFNKSRCGAKKLLYRLTVEKGVDRRIAENVLADVVDDEFERERCVEIAKKYADRKRLDIVADRQKIGAYLYQKGFDGSLINETLGTWDVD